MNRNAMLLFLFFFSLAPIRAAEARCLGVLHFELHAGLAELGRRESRTAAVDKSAVRAILDKSVYNATEAVTYLQHEPNVLCEGQMCKQALMNIDSLKSTTGLSTPMRK